MIKSLILNRGYDPVLMAERLANAKTSGGPTAAGKLGRDYTNLDVLYDALGINGNRTGEGPKWSVAPVNQPGEETFRNAEREAYLKDFYPDQEIIEPGLEGWSENARRFGNLNDAQYTFSQNPMPLSPSQEALNNANAEMFADLDDVEALERGTGLDNDGLSDLYDEILFNLKKKPK